MAAGKNIRYFLARKLPNGSVRYYARVRVPKDLSNFYGATKEIKKALMTSDRQVALERLHEAVSEIQFEFKLQRKKSTREYSSSIDASNRRRIIRRHFYSIHDRSEKLMVNLSYEKDFALILDGIKEEISSLKGGNEEWLPSIQETVRQLLSENYVALDTNSEDFWAMCDLVRRAMLEVKKREFSNLSGRPGRSFDELFDGIEVEEINASERPDEEITIRQFIDLFNSAEGSKNSEKKKLEYGMVYRLMLEHWKEKTSLKQIRRSDVREIKNTLDRLPPNASKRFKEKSLSEIAQFAIANNLRPMSPTTANGN